VCLAIPGRVTAVYDVDGLRMGKVDFGGVVKDVCLAYLPDLVLGEYVVVHAGFAISKLDEVAALETLRNFADLEPRDEGSP
jgi:hydrogenase expression/formation protein HypC